jgi:Asp-tRNA(Asn)/Glu-tRNA(Gln) amidotransferase C subunit
LAKKIPRRLFLDDDPERAAIFLERHPDAVWVQTVPECLAKLADIWDEIHLDHDLGGEHYVDVNRDDCGMEVIRWLARERRKHLRRSKFTVHSHNIAAAFEMVMNLQALGYQVDARPFGVEAVVREAEPSSRLERIKLRVRKLLRYFRRFDPSEGDQSGDVI